MKVFPLFDETLPKEICANGRVFPVKYEKILRATSSIKIKEGFVLVRLSRYLIGRQRERTLEKFLDWAVKRLEKASVDDFINPVYEDGGRVVTHNKIYEINVYFTDRKNSRVVLEAGHLLMVYLPKALENSEKESRRLLKNLCEKTIVEDQTAYLKEVIDELNGLYFQEKFVSCRFKRVNGRFGSLSRKGNINIAFRLLFAPREVFRYVCVHELAHLKEFNHSKKFWQVVESAMPDYKQHEKWLRHKGFLLG